MSKNTGTSELINYFTLGASGAVDIGGNLTLSTIANATTDTDKFLVSDTGIIKYRTGTQLLSDIGAQASGNYVTTDTTQSITGVKTFNSGSLILAANGTASPTIIRNTSGTTGTTGGHNTIGFNSNNNIFVDTTNSGGFIFDFNNSVSNRTYTLQNASGTLAFTSQIPTVVGVYLPLAGGTLTGALNGTSATFSSTAFINSPINNTVITTSDATNIANGFNLLASSSYWGIRTATGGDFKLDVFGAGVPKNALSIAQSTGAATFSSSVGINGATPVAELQVGKASDVTIAMSNSSSVTSGNRGSLAWYNSSTSTVANIRAVAVTDNVGTELQFYTRPAAGSLTQVMTITSGGNLLIGTTTDNGAKLQVSGTGNVTNSTSGNALIVGSTYAGGRNIQIGISDGSILPTASAYINDNTGVGVYIGDNSASTKGLYVKYGGNVGIGTASPTSQSTGATTGILDVSAAAGGNLVLHRTGSSDTALFSIIKSSNGTYIDSVGAATAANNAIYFRTNNINADQTSVTTALTIASTGAATFSSTLDAKKGTFTDSFSLGLAQLNAISNSGANSSYAGVRLVNTSSNGAYFTLGDVSTATWYGAQSAFMTLGGALGVAFKIRVDADDTKGITIPTSGNVGIGTATPTSVGTFTTLEIRGATGGGIKIGKTAFAQFNIQQDGTDAYLNNTANGSLYMYTNDTERMQITSGGNVLFNCASTPSASVAGFQINGTSSGNISSSGTSTVGYNHLLFYNGNGLVGYIQTNGSTTTYSTSSDYRLKKDVQPITDALARIQLLNPVKYKWKCDDSDGEGFIAHELQEIIPYSVTGEKDGEEMQGVDYSKIVPVLVKAIQEQQEQIQELKNKLS